MCDIGLFAAQIDGLRMFGTEAAGDLLFALGDREIARFQPVDHRTAALLRRDRGVVDRVLLAAFDDCLVALVARGGAGRIGLGEDQLAIQIGELLVGHELPAGFGQAMLGTELLGLQGGGLGILAQIVEPPLQPHGGALRGIEIGVELVGQVSLAIGSGDGAGELRVVRIDRGVDDQAATNPLDVKTVLQQRGRT